VASSSPATSASTATSLAGNENYKVAWSTIRELWDGLQSKLITNSLDQGGWQVSTYGAYRLGFRDLARSYTQLEARPSVSAFGLIKFALARSLTRLFAIGGDAGARLDAFYDDALSTVTGESFQPAFNATAIHVPWWKRSTLTPTRLDLDEYVESLHVSGPRAAHFLHFTHTHYPVEFDASCRWAAGEMDWFFAHQDWEGVVDQTQCALREMVGVIQRLEELGVYDNSLVILKSDHGEPIKYNDYDSIESFGMRGHEIFGLGRYAPFLAIKGFGQASQPLAFDSHPVLLDDLAKTLCVNADPANDCATYTGYDLLGGDWLGIEDDTITVFVVRDAMSSFVYDAHEALTMTRGRRILASLHHRLSDEILTDGVPCARRIDVASGQPLDNGRSDLRSWLTWHDGGSSFIRFRMSDTCSSVEVLVDGLGAEPVDNVQMFVNGNPVAIRDGASLAESTTDATIAIGVPAAVLVDIDDVEVEVRHVDPAAPNVMIKGVDLGSVAAAGSIHSP
jgi:hypothetical protein